MRRAKRRSNFENGHAKFVELVAAGETLVGACEQVGVNPHTARNWISEGRRTPEGRYGGFVKALDAARASVRLDREEEDGYEPGPVEREVRALIAGRNLDAHGRIAGARDAPWHGRWTRSRPPGPDRRPWGSPLCLGASMT
jgi:hypothetical protein